jgi:hypothetical protein
VLESARRESCPNRRRRSLIVALALTLALCACGKRASAPAPQPAREPQPARAPTPHPAPPPPTAADPLATFTAKLATRVTPAETVVAVLPISADGRATGLSNHLADRVQAALLDAGFRVVDRGSLPAAIMEIDLGRAFEAPSAATALTAADLLIVGRYALTGGKLHVDLKAVAVASNEILAIESFHTDPTPHERELAFAALQSRADPGATSVREHDGKILVRAAYKEAGGDKFHLLDRVRQRIRAGLAAYVRDALGRTLSPEELDRLYRRGREVDCHFDRGAVTLEMEFGVPR